MSRSMWLLLILIILVVGGAFYFASIDTKQPMTTIEVPVTNAQ